MNKLRILILNILPVLALVSCNNNDPAPRVFDLDYMAHVFPENFVTVVNNSYLPLTVGSTFVYESETAQGHERTEVEILPETRVVLGITCVVVRDKVYINDVIHEDTYDWYAQDKDGNVWYMGERVDNYDNGVVVNHYGSWESGVDGAEPGIMMLGNPVSNLKYRQEHYLGQAEDQGEIISKRETVTVAAGTFKNCLKIRETNPLEVNFLEFKYYAPGVGMIKVEKVEAITEIEELVSFSVK